jgi:hypothetical protein
MFNAEEDFETRNAEIITIECFVLRIISLSLVMIGSNARFIPPLISDAFESVTDLFCDHPDCACTLFY